MPPACHAAGAQLRHRRLPHPFRSSSDGPLVYRSSFPCGARRQNPAAAGIAYVVPVDAGRTRQFHTFISLLLPEEMAAAAPEPPPSTGPWARAAASANLWWQRNVPKWMAHLDGHTILDADIAIQSGADRNRAADARVYMPAAVDAGPAAFMRWLREHGGGGPFAGRPPAPPEDRRALLDRFGQHTARCKSCRTAHARLSAAATAAGAAALMLGAAALAAGALMAFGWPAAVARAAATAAAGRAALVLAGAAALAAVAHRQLSRVVQRFVFVDYDKHHVSKM
jgi:hypothetical protein